MSAIRLVVVHNNIDQESAIGKLAMWSTTVGLDAGFEVIAVARDLEPSLTAHVTHVPLHVPRAVFAYQWARARSTVRSALRGRSWDLLHTFQPQLTSMADTWHAQFLTRTAIRTASIPQGRNPRSVERRVQVRAVGVLEDRYLRCLPSSVDVLFPSELMRDEFARLYGPPARSRLLPNPAPALDVPTEAERRRARAALVGSFAGTVVGFLGGCDERKGGRALVDGIALTPGIFLLLGGAGSDQFADGRLAGRCRSVGYVRDVRTFLAACDILAVPSRFDPFAMVVTEAAARGVPTITTPTVGVHREALEWGATVAWDGQPRSFPSVVAQVASSLEGLGSRAMALAGELSGATLAVELRAAWEEALAHSQRCRGRSASA